MKTNRTLPRPAANRGPAGPPGPPGPPATSIAWGDVTGKPGTYPPEPHGDHLTVADAAAAAPVQSVAGRTGTVTLAKADVGLSNADNTSDAAKPVSTATQTALDAKQATSQKGQANGYPGLDANGLVPVSQLPGLPAAWGTITGVLSTQTDLQAALDAKAASSHTHAGVYEPADAAIQTHVAQAHAPSNAQKNSDITKAEIEAKLTGEISSHTHAGGGLTLAQVYPIGCIYTSTVNTNPATVFGIGTWSAFGAGRVLVGLDSGDTAFDAAEETGGAKTVASAGTVSAPTITVNALSGGTRKGGTSNPGSIIENGNVPTASSSAPTFTGSATSVVQPYIVVYFWKRTA